MNCSNVLYEGWKVTPHITQDNDGTINQSAELGKGEVGYNVGMTTVKSLPSPSVYTHRSVEFRVRKFLRILDGDSHIIVQLITGNCVSVKRIVGYVFRSPNHKASMYYSNVLHDMNRFILHYPNNRNLMSMCNGVTRNCWVMINILIRTLDTFDSRNRVVMTSVNGGVM